MQNSSEGFTYKLHVSNFILIIALVLIMPSCIKEYWPDLKGASDNLLVVDGKITNEPGPYTVKLSRSSPIQNPGFIPVENATVTIIDAVGVQEVLHESSNGIYQTTVNGIHGIIGHKYKLIITTQQNETYESDFEELLAPVGVASIDYKEETQIVDNGSDIGQKGYQFYLTTDMAPDKKNYYYWELEETFEYHSAYQILFYFNGIFVPPDEAHPLGLQRTLNPDTLFACWKTGNLKERFTYSTQYLSVPLVEDLPLHFVPFSDERVQKKYCVLAKQYTVSEGVYTFLKALEEQNSNQNGLITTQPYQVRGNVRNTNDPEEPVLGYFVAAAEADGPRVFVSAPQYYNLTCGFDTVTYNIKRYISQANPGTWPLYFTYVYFPNPDNPMGEAIEALALVYQDCLDCTLKGGVAIRPYFWQ